MQLTYAPGLVHMVISLEPNANRTDSHACFLTIIRDNSGNRMRIIKHINYLIWKYGLMPKTNAATARIASPTLQMHIQFATTVEEINQRLEYHYKLPSKHRKHLSPIDQRAHHRLCEIPVMSAGICVEHTCNQHRDLRHQLNRQWVVTVDEQELTYHGAGTMNSHYYYHPLPLYDSRIDRVRPTRKDFRRRELLNMQHDIASRGGVTRPQNNQMRPGTAPH
jgi:hypothetical protein